MYYLKQGKNSVNINYKPDTYIRRQFGLRAPCLRVYKTKKWKYENSVFKTRHQPCDAMCMFFLENDPIYLTSNYQNISLTEQQQNLILKYSCVPLLRYQPDSTSDGISVCTPLLVLSGQYLASISEGARKYILKCMRIFLGMISVFYIQPFCKSTRILRTYLNKNRTYSI